MPGLLKLALQKHGSPIDSHNVQTGFQLAGLKTPATGGVLIESLLAGWR
jgi:hypothetical protein